MKLKEKVVRRQLKALGIDVSNPQNLAFKTIKDIINSSVPCLIGQKQMIEFLEDWIQKLKDEFGD